LSEIQFPRNWRTIAEKGVSFIVECSDGIFTKLDGSGTITMPYRIEIQLHSGYFETIQDLLAHINGKLKYVMSHPMEYGKLDSATFPIFRYEEKIKRVIVRLTAQMTISFSPALASILGCVENNPLINASNDITNREGSEIADITGGISSLFVYCDLLEHVPVGDVEAPLLRVVSAQGKNGETINRTYEKPRYIPLQKKNFDSVEIFIRDDLGNLIPFESGKLTVTLHFRRAKNPYFL